MSNQVLDNLLKFLAEQSLTLDILATLSDADLSSLPAPNGGQLHVYQKLALKGAVNKYRESSESHLRMKQLEEENKKLRDGVEEANMLNAQRKIKLSHIKSHFEYASAKALKDVQKMMQDLRRLGSTLDICFCIDGTGSMSDVIDSVKKCIVSLSNKITSATGMACRFALIVYKDYCDGENRIQVFQFCNSSILQEHLGTVSADGGGDTAEDCFGGIFASLTQIEWASPSKVIIWMGDAPQHGLKYSGSGDASDCDDEYPDGDPNGITSDIIFQKLQELKIILVFCKLNESTNTMMTQLRQEVESYGGGLLLEYNLSGDIAEFLTSTIFTVTSRTSSFGGHRPGAEKPYVITPLSSWDVSESSWRQEEKCRVLEFKPYVGKDLHPLLDLLLDGAHVKERTIMYALLFNQ